MKIIISFCIFILSVTSVQSQNLSIFGELHDSTTIIVDSLGSFDVNNGFVYIKIGSNYKVKTILDVSTLEKVENPTNKIFEIFTDTSNLDFFKNTESCVRPNSILYIYDSLHNLIFFDSSIYSSYSQTPNQTHVFASSSTEDSRMDIYDIQSKKKTEIRINPFWKAIAPNDSLIIVCNESELRYIDLIFGDIGTVLYHRYYGIPQWFVSQDRSNSFLHWGDSLYLFDSQGEMVWRKNGNRKIQNICFSSDIKYALMSSYYRDRIESKIIEVSTGQELVQFTSTIDGVTQLTNLQFIDKFLIVQSEYVISDLKSKFRRKLITYLYSFNFENNKVTLLYQVEGAIFLSKNKEFLRTFQLLPDNPNEIIVKDWKQ